ncbi:MAG: proton-conducting transporter membrane subunit [Miltoncostaeaceae bacterium]
MILLAVLATSLVPALIIFALPEERHGLRTALNLTGAVLKVALVGILLWDHAAGREHEVRIALMPDLPLVLRVDALALLFVSLSAALWLLTTIYAIGYLEGSPFRSRFFGFFSLCVTATVGIALSGNLITFFVFYEALTLATYPLVVHRGTSEALAAGRVYLNYTLGGGTVLLAGVVWLESLAGPIEFTRGGMLAPIADDQRAAVAGAFVLIVAGLAVKAAMVPLHGWLARAMVAPAPVSALLHAVAVVKAGAFGIIRVVDDVYGRDLVADLGLLTPLALAACITIVWGSLRAIAQDDLKRRLAYSTVSQVSYVILGVAIIGPIATVGGLVHLVHQGIMKITLFFGAGVLAETLGIHRVSQMRGVGRRAPLTMAAFTVAALGMIGVPPTAGFISKWYLGLGAASAGMVWALWVLVLSGVLNAIYLLPIVYLAWFREPVGDWPAERPRRRLEAAPALLVPTLITGVVTLAAGLLAGTDLSPLSLAQQVDGDPSP